MTFPLCGCFHHAHPGCLTCCVGFLLQNNTAGVIFVLYANVCTDIHFGILLHSEFKYDQLCIKYLTHYSKLRLKNVLVVNAIYLYLHQNMNVQYSYLWLRPG